MFKSYIELQKSPLELIERRMVKYCIITCIIVWASAFAEWIDFGTSDRSHARVEVVEVTETGFTADLILPGFNNQTSIQNGVLFNSLGVPSMTPYAEYEGAPTLPKASFMAAVPLHGDVSVTVEPLMETVVFQQINPSPMQPIPLTTAMNRYPLPMTPGHTQMAHIPQRNSVSIEPVRSGESPWADSPFFHFSGMLKPER